MKIVSLSILFRFLIAALKDSNPVVFPNIRLDQKRNEFLDKAAMVPRLVRLKDISTEALQWFVVTIV